MTIETIWIIGAGKFGRRAVKTLAREKGGRAVTVVDRDALSLAEAAALGCTTIAADGIGFLHENLGAAAEGPGPDWIIPAVPVHLAWEWLRLELPGLERVPLPPGAASGLPNAMRGETGDLYVSHADFLCPPNCNEPDEICTKTREPRKPDLFRLLREAGLSGIHTLVIQSRQLGPGVGGYRPRALLDLAADLRSWQGPFAVATACRCHGVITAGRVAQEAKNSQV